MHRIPHRSSSNPVSNEYLQNSMETLSDTIRQKPSLSSGMSKPPVLVHHGLLSSSADWVLLGPEKAFAYALCDSGFDVWLANARGNAYSQHHKQYTVNDKEFWDFSWHEIGYYDVPAMIDYILETTGHNSLYYVGYSQGTTAFYVMASERPEYNAKVKAMISMAPVAFLANQRSPFLKCVVPFHALMKWGSLFCNMHRWFQRSKLQTKTLSGNVPSMLAKTICISCLNLVAGFGSNQLQDSMLPLIFEHFPAGSSVRQIIHYSQSIMSGTFRQYDYGVTKNLKLYGSMHPPNYNLEKVKVPVSIFYSENDFLTDPNDVQTLADKLPNVIAKHKIEYRKFNHIDYLWGADAKTLVYNNVVKMLKRM
ncbi:lipase 3 isoform X2 [Cephus cinctus]|nr:lipase 3 isoform X2 [Cephus cinctus]